MLTNGHLLTGKYYTDTLTNTMPKSPYMWELEKYSNVCKFEVKWFDDQRQPDSVLEGWHFCVEYLYQFVLLLSRSY